MRIDTSVLDHVDIGKCYELVKLLRQLGYSFTYALNTAIELSQKEKTNEH